MSQPLPPGGRGGRPIIDYGLAYLQQPPQQAQAPPAPAYVPPKAPPAAPMTADQVLGLSRTDRRSRPDADKVFEIEEYLSSVPGHRMVDAAELYEVLGLDLRPGVGGEEGVLKLLEAHPKIKVLPTPGQYQYVSKYLIRDRPQLLAWLHKYRNGLRQSDIKDCYPGIVSDLSDLVKAGDVLAVKDDKDLVVFSRGPPFLVRLSGDVELADDDDRCFMSKDLRTEIRRGEAVRVGDEWFRVSTAEDRKVQRLRAEPPLTVSVGAGRLTWPPEDLRSDLDFKAQNSAPSFRDGFSPEDGLPLSTAWPSQDKPYPEGPVAAVRHGCTTDVKELLWSKTREKVPKDDAELKKKLEEAALGAHASAAPKRPRVTAQLSKAMQRKRKKEEAEERWRQELKAKADLAKAQQDRAAARAAARQQQANGGGGAAP